MLTREQEWTAKLLSVAKLRRLFTQGYDNMMTCDFPEHEPIHYAHVFSFQWGLVP